jgi:DNA-binding transcriptional LysR family regulator
MQSDFAPELMHGLLTGRLDLAPIAHLSPNRKLTMAKVSEAPFYIAIPENHPIVSKDVLTLGDLRGCTWIMFDCRVHPMLHVSIFRRAAEEGIAYRNKQNVIAADEAFQLVADNVGVAFLTMASALRTKMPG